MPPMSYRHCVIRCVGRIQISRAGGLACSSSWTSGGGTVRFCSHAAFPPPRRRAAATAAAAAAASEQAGLGYWTLAEPMTIEVEVKKSRFVVTAWPIDSGEQAAELIAGASDSAASHNCWAWRAGAASRSSDDGEPGGTAGRPILAAITGDNIDRAAVLVTRHFGGVKLGAGGLTRAYGGAARDCLRAAPKRYVAPRAALAVSAPFAQLGAIYACMARHGAAPARNGETYDAAGDATVTFVLDAAAADAAIAACADATSGRARVERVEVPAAADEVEQGGDSEEG